MQQHIAQAHHKEKNYVFLQDPVFQELKLADADGHREVGRVMTYQHPLLHFYEVALSLYY
jgi:hypothetical protein